MTERKPYAEVAVKGRLTEGGIHVQVTLDGIKSDLFIDLDEFTKDGALKLALFTEAWPTAVKQALAEMGGVVREINDGRST